jgi:hypothetical protein
MTGITKKLISGLAFLAWVLICGEIFLRVITSIFLIYNVEMLKYAKSLKVKSENPNISHIHRANSSARLMGVDISLNSMGHRNAELSNPKKKNEKRIYFIGSSILLGWGVEEKDTFPKIVEKNFRETKDRGDIDYKAVNAGIGNYNTFYQVELFTEQVSAVDPDIVVLQYYINDAEDNPKGSNNIIFKYSLLASSAHFYIQTILFKARGSLEEYYSGMYGEDSAGWKRAQASIKKLKRMCDDKNITLLALLIPDLHNLSNAGALPMIYKKVQNSFEQTGIPMKSTFPALQKYFKNDPREAWVAKDDPHANKAAHKIIGNELYDFIVDRKLG